MLNPRFSIIIPTLNEEEFLPKLLDDLSKQTRKEFEVIVVDGNSEDNTKHVSENFQKYVPMRFFLVKKRGLSYQRNYGAARAHGSYLIFLDADTRVNRSFVSNLIEEVSKNQYLVYLPTITPEGENNIDQSLYQLANFIIKISVSHNIPFVCGSPMMFEKNYFHFLGGYAEKHIGNKLFPEDQDIIIRAYKNGVKAKFLSKVKVRISLRRMEKEGRLQTYHTYIISGLQMRIKGKLETNINYEMGGQFYKNNKTGSSLNRSSQIDVLKQIGQFLDTLLKEN